VTELLGIRAYRHTTSYPAYKQTSFNLERRGRTTAHVAVHVKYSYADRGFWLGYRWEWDVHRHDERMKELFDKLRHAQREFHCGKCGKVELGPPGMGHPADWEMDFCGTCVSSYTYRELLKPSAQEPTQSS